MPQKIPSIGDAGLDAHGAGPAHSSKDPGTRLGRAFAQLTTTIEDNLEKALDMLLGPSTEESLRPQIPVHKKKKRKNKKLDREGRRQKEAEEANQKLYESEVKAQKLAEAMLALEKAKVEYEAEMEESEETNRTLILQFTMVQVGGLYAVSQACLLAIFVPQKCPAIIAANYTSPWFKYSADAKDGHLCTMKEKLDWFNLSAFNQGLVTLNIITLALMLSAQSYFWKREVWFVEHLEEDNSIPYDSLPTMIKGYDEFEEQVRSYNVGGYAFASTLAAFIALNLSLSTYFLVQGDGVYNYNIGSRTYTGLITNTMLVSTKIVGFWSYARLSYENSWAISMFTVIPLSYNRVDDEYRGVYWKTEEEIKEEIEAKPIDPMPPGWGKPPEAEPEDDMA